MKKSARGLNTKYMCFSLESDKSHVFVTCESLTDLFRSVYILHYSDLLFGFEAVKFHVVPSPHNEYRFAIQKV